MSMSQKRKLKVSSIHRSEINIIMANFPGNGVCRAEEDTGSSGHRRRSTDSPSSSRVSGDAAPAHRQHKEVWKREGPNSTTSAVLILAQVSVV